MDILTLDKKKIPNHIAVIMDGNGRWAKKRDLDRVEGHKEGVEAVKRTVKACIEADVKFLTIYAFSIENWARPLAEVESLMELMVFALNSEIEELNRQGVSLKTIGDISMLPRNAKAVLQDCIDRTKNNNKLTLVVALSYGSRWEIVEACKKIASNVNKGEQKIEDICEKTLNDSMCLPDLPDPDLLIRTSGERRLSNFLLWQLAYTEFYFIDKFWPDFQKEDLYLAIYNYQNRERRFGKTSEQI